MDILEMRLLSLRKRLCQVAATELVGCSSRQSTEIVRQSVDVQDVQDIGRTVSNW